MKKSIKAPKTIDAKRFEAICKRMNFRHEVEKEIDDIQSQIRQKAHQTHMNFLEEIARRAGIDTKMIIEEGLRRNKVQRRMKERGFMQIRQKAQKFAKEQSLIRREATKRYHKRFSREILKSEGNPCLLIWEPVTGIPPTPVLYRDNPGGMVGSGCKEPHMAEHEHEDEIVLAADYSHENHLFYPRVYVATGDDDSHVYLRLHQNVMLGRRALESGRGNFNAERVQLWLSGTGYCEIRGGDPCPFGPGGIGPTAEASVGLYIDLFQINESGGFEQIDILELPNFWIETNSYSGDVNITPYIGPLSRPVEINSPDTSGGEIWILFSLQTYVGAYENEARAELDFTRPDWDGLNLIDIRLCGEYER